MPGGNCCAFRGCHSRSGQGISLFSFPKDPEQAKLWLEACYRSDLLSKATILHNSSYRLCEVHFQEKFISKGSLKKRLFPNAIPSIFFTKRNDGTENTSETTKEASEESKKEASERSKKEAFEGNKTMHKLSDILVVPPCDKKDFSSAATIQPSFMHDEFEDDSNIIIEYDDDIDHDTDEYEPSTLENCVDDETGQFTPLDKTKQHSITSKKESCLVRKENSDFLYRKEMFKQFVIKIIDEITTEDDLKVVERMFAHIVPLPDEVQENV